VRIRIIAATNRQPAWVEQAYTEYARRLRRGLEIDLTEVPLAPRRASANQARAIEDEGTRILRAVPKGAYVVALHEAGAQWSTRELARALEQWMAARVPVSLLIGGPDGLSPRCLATAGAQWSVSPLTLPHGIVKIVAAEALYRAWSLLNGHPYHRQ
jgi:23S rRNA (pseudouridine1915-N3)-methyltransferase